MKIQPIIYHKNIKMRILKVVGILAGTLASFVLYKAGRIYLIRRKYRHIPGPSTTGVIGYFFGNTSDIVKFKNEGKVFVDFLTDW